jgi:hypothetical protein
MTERRGDQGFSVAPRRIGGGPGDRRPRRRLPRPGVAIVAAVGAGIVAIAAIGPRLSDRPSFDVSFFATPTPDPSRTASPTVTPSPTELTTSRATPLPAITRPDGGSLTGRIVYQTFGIHSIDLETGEVIDGPDVQLGRDALIHDAHGTGWTCICFEDLGVEGPNGLVQTRHVRIMGLDEQARLLDSTDLTDVEVRIPAEPSIYDLATDVDVFDAQRRGLLAVMSRSGGPWRLSIAAIDVERRTAGRLVDLDARIEPPSATAPGPAGSSPPVASPAAADSYTDGPHVRVAPDGRYALVWTAVQTNDPNGPSAAVVRAWRVTLASDGSIGAISDAPGLAAMPGFCNSLGFAAADRAVFLCPGFLLNQAGSDQGWILGTIGADGESAGQLQLSAKEGGFFSEPLIDRSSGLIYAWDPINLAMRRVDAHTLAAETVTIDPASRSTTGIAERGGRSPVWGDADSVVEQLGYGQIAGSPDGARIYALAFSQRASYDSMSQSSRGVFVFDRATLALLDRWAPAANYLSVAAVDDRVIAGGLPGFDEAGHEAPWEASLTLYDAASGRILVRFGQLGPDAPPLVATP